MRKKVDAALDEAAMLMPNKKIDATCKKSDLEQKYGKPKLNLSQGWSKALLITLAVTLVLMLMVGGSKYGSAGDFDAFGVVSNEQQEGSDESGIDTFVDEDVVDRDPSNLPENVQEEAIDADLPSLKERESVPDDEPGGERFQIIVLAYQRVSSLKRLLESLEAADYMGDRIALNIHIDGGKGSKWEKTVAFANSYEWPHGSKTIRVADKNHGLAHAWLTAYMPRHDDDHCIILEDDITVSPLFYRYLRLMWTKYGDRPEVAGITLQRQHIKATTGGKKEIKNNEMPFLYKLVGSWGFSPKPSVWKQFMELKFKKTNPNVPGLITSKWFRFKKKGSIWTQYYIWYCEQHNLYTLYLNGPNKSAFATNWREKGEHYGHTMGADAPVITKEMWDVRWNNPPDILNMYGWDTKFIDKSHPPKDEDPNKQILGQFWLNGEDEEQQQDEQEQVSTTTEEEQPEQEPIANEDEEELQQEQEEQDQTDDVVDSTAEQQMEVNVTLEEVPHDFSGLVQRARDLIKKSSSNYFVMQLLNAGFVEMTTAWICNVRDLPNVLDRTVFVCTDEEALTQLTQFAQDNNLNLNLYLQKFEQKQSSLRYGHLTYHHFMLFRAQLLDTLMHNKVSVLLTEADATWMGDVLGYLEKNIDEAVDMVTLNDNLRNKRSLNGGFLWLRPTEITTQVVTKLHQILSATLKKLAGRENIGQAGNEQFMFEKIIQDRKKAEGKVNIVYLQRQEFAPGQWYRSGYKTLGLQPKVVLNNWLRSGSSKVSRARRWGHWFLEKDGKSCKAKDIPTLFNAGDLAVDTAHDWSKIVSAVAGFQNEDKVLHVEIVDASDTAARLQASLCEKKDDNVLVVCFDEASCKVAKSATTANANVKIVQDTVLSCSSDMMVYRIYLTHRLLQTSVKFVSFSSSKSMSSVDLRQEEFDILTSTSTNYNPKEVNPNFVCFRNNVGTQAAVSRAVIAQQKAIYSTKKPISFQASMEMAIKDIDLNDQLEPVNLKQVDAPKRDSTSNGC